MLYREFKTLDLPAIEREISAFWDKEGIFEKSVNQRNPEKAFIFYEGPPSANGMPGIHHVMSRTIKDLFCRYKTLQGFRVERKGGWDTHGLPVELAVEKELGIKKEDIGTKISVADYNKKCRSEVLKYKDAWDHLTRLMGFWVDLQHPYITFENEYIESLWWLLKQLYQKGYLYKGLTIQPYSPAAGTGLSSHELNYAGSYRMVKDTSVTAQFKIIYDARSAFLFDTEDEEVFFLAWTTTPWTLPSNTALAVGADITYRKVKTENPYTHQKISVILAEDLMPKYFGDNQPVYDSSKAWKGKELENIRYEQLLPYVKPDTGEAFKVIIGDFVTTDEGTGIVHIAPSFGADDMRMAKMYGLATLTLVDKQGKFVDEMGEFAGRYVKNYKDEPDYQDVNVDIAVKLKKENRAFRIEKYEHSYPHCWRTDKPVIYYPLDSWFIKTTAVKQRMIELNNTINWKPPFTGSGRFGNWLENLVDWNLSRSRYWGTPLPIWRSEDGTEEVCIGSVEELKEQVSRSVKAGILDPLYLERLNTGDYDLHKPFVDELVLVSPSGKKMFREPDLVDVWFDSGAMPYAQWHYPFENTDKIDRGLAFPADFISEGVDQTRGWFFTLHALAVLLFDSVAFKNVLSHGLLLDKNGNKMSKRLGNTIDPFQAITTYGADAVRWYMISNSDPWENLKFNLDGVAEVQRKLFATLYNTYAFFSLYANIDGYVPDEASTIPLSARTDMDRWIISKLHNLARFVQERLDDYDPTPAARAIEEFVNDHLSNWYVRLSRRRFWKGEMHADKQAAYDTLHQCLYVTAQLMSPFAPFFAEWLYRNLMAPIKNFSGSKESVHLTDLFRPDETCINATLEEQMDYAQRITSLVLSLRKKVNIKVRQPLNKILVPVLNESIIEKIEPVRDLILSEVNVKQLEYVYDTSGVIRKKIKPDFKKLGARLGPRMKAVTNALASFSQEDIRKLEREGVYELAIDGEIITLKAEEVEITSEDIPGWTVATRGNLTVALDIQITDALMAEGIARELINRIQNLRKESDFKVTDRIVVEIENRPEIKPALINFKGYICSEILAEQLNVVDSVANGTRIEVNDIPVKVNIKKAETWQ
ncbi:MAG: isoleucine--tRNA ligase [Chitinophagales bacterium]|nr:MAG: isoleucine--tRNA ligase [Chitinophagales bacterium]